MHSSVQLRRGCLQCRPHLSIIESGDAFVCAANGVYARHILTQNNALQQSLCGVSTTGGRRVMTTYQTHRRVSKAQVDKGC